jgi:hypothetical protein
VEEEDEMKEGYLPLKNSILLKLWGLSRFLPKQPCTGLFPPETGLFSRE